MITITGKNNEDVSIAPLGTAAIRLKIGGVDKLVIGSSGNTTVANIAVNGATIPANGMYLPVANYLAFTTNSVQRWYIDPSGHLEPGLNNTYNIGSSGFKPANIFATDFWGSVGSAGSPTFSFIGDENTGMYSTGADALGLSQGGTLRWEWVSGGGFYGRQATNSIVGRNPASNQNSNLQLYGSDSAANGAFIGLYGVSQDGSIEYRTATAGGANPTHRFFTGASGNEVLRITDTQLITAYYQIQGSNGSASAPSFSFQGGASNSGWYNLASDNVALSINGTDRIRSNDIGTITMSAYGAGTATFDASGNISSVSDARAKNNIVYENIPGLSEILQINPAYYNLNSETQDTRSENEKYKRAIVKNEAGEDVESLEFIPWQNNGRHHRYLGFIAQDLLPIIPSYVGLPQEEGGMYGFMDRPIIAALV